MDDETAYMIDEIPNVIGVRSTAPSKKARLGELLQQLAPIIMASVAAKAGGARAGASALGGFREQQEQMTLARQREQTIAQARQDRLDSLAREQADADRTRQDRADTIARVESEKKANFRLKAIEALNDIDDPVAWTQAAQQLDETYQQLFGGEPGAIKNGRTFPESKKMAADQAAALKLKTELEKTYGPQIWDANPTVTFQGKPVKFHDLVALSGLQVRKESGDHLTPAPVIPPTTGTVAERLAKLKGQIRAANTTGNTAEAARLKAEHDDIITSQKDIGQADDRPPQPRDPSIADGRRFSQEQRLVAQWDKAMTPFKEMRRQFGLMESGLKRFRQGDKNGGSQAVLITFQKILDPTSVVRESEYARSAAGTSLLSRIEGYVDRLEAGGAGLPDADLAAMVQTAKEFLSGMTSYNDGLRKRIGRTAVEYNLDPRMIFDDLGVPNGDAETPRPTTAKPALRFNPDTGKTEPVR